MNNKNSSSQVVNNSPSIHNKVKEPFVRVTKRDTSTFTFRTIIHCFAGLLSLVMILVFLNQVTGLSFSKVWKYMIQGSFFTSTSRHALIQDAMLLLCVALALTPAFKMKFWNIGAQGQIIVGGLAAAIVMWYCKGFNNGTMIFVMLIAAVVAGGIWAIIPAFFKVKLNANETLFTLMMNYVGIQFAEYFINKWKGQSSALPTINSDSRLGYLTKIGTEPFALIAVIVSLIALFIYIYMNKTKHGYEISVVGESLNTAKYAGMNTGKIIMRTLFLSGALCGLCGFLFVGGVDHVISTSTGKDYGFTAIIVTWVANFNPIAMALVSFLIMFLSKGAGNVKNFASTLNNYVADIVVGVFLFFIIGCEFFINYRLVFNSKITAVLDKIKNWKVFRFIAKYYGIFANKVQSIYQICVGAINKFFAKRVSSILALLTKIFSKKSKEDKE